MVGGVCGGLAVHLGIDSTLVRIFFVLLMFGNGIGALLYFLLWMIIPLEGQERSVDLSESVRQGSQEIAERARMMGDDIRGMVRQPNPKSGVIIGAALVVLGVIYLLDNLQIPYLRWLNFDMLWPVLLILGGLALLLRRARGD
jgi:phage shock protein PspC (stress-responsive transcriptional regulator)